MRDLFILFPDDKHTRLRAWGVSYWLILPSTRSPVADTNESLGKITGKVDILAPTPRIFFEQYDLMS